MQHIKTLIIVTFSFLSLDPVMVHSDEPIANEPAATGFVHVKQMDGVWWFVGPDGKKFVSTGVNHIEPHLWLAPYNKAATLERYGADMVDSKGRFNTSGEAAKKWIDRQIEICKELHFNTFAKHTHPMISPQLYKDKIFYIVSLETAPLAGWRERKGQGPRPDVFSRDFEDFVESRVKEACAQHKDSPNLLGYLYTDVPSWVVGRADQKKRGDTTMIYQWVNAILPLGEASPGKQKWIDHLKSRYPDAESAAKIWGMPVSPTYGVSWNEMARMVDWSNSTDKAKAKSDMESFMPLVAERWYQLHHDLVRKYDSNHLILGDKNMLNWHYDWMIPAMKKYVDVVAVQSYGRWEDDVKLADELYRKVGKPIFNGDGCFGYADSNQQEWGVKGFRTGAKSFQEVAELYRETMEGMMSTPYVIGWHHCGYMQQWDKAERGDSPRNENGFMDPFEKFHTEWTRVIKEYNAKANELHEAAK